MDCLIKSIWRALEGSQLGAEELACLERHGLASGELMPPRPLLVYRALQLGVRIDLQRLSRLINWDEFEQIVALILEGWGYSVQRGLRLECARRKAEFDVVGWNRYMVLALEVKHWKYGGGRWESVVGAHVEKTRACLPKLKALAPLVIPAVVTLSSTNALIGGVPVVSIYGLLDLLRNIEDLRDKVLVLF